ncbi:MAG: hypothetical protein HC879_03985 [Leptolyngbyaceae cyanobacterium SL_5_9]|nr:hypothetical protein [Leptolyngbyaceae cyanobacterium SL_5_9]NJO73216.1 hypothetical protein [Leptolyngbyaceae cyanobacterium RM1_406_9]
MGSLLSQRSPSPQEAQTYPNSAETFTPSSASPQQAPQQDRLTAAPQETCPQCSSRLGPPLKSSGRQVCAKCGWTDKPKGTISQTISQRSEVSRSLAPTAASLADYELKKLLDQAASESLNNMKPKRKQDQQPHKQLPLEDEGK